MNNKEKAIERARGWVQTTVDKYEKSIQLIEEMPDDMPGEIEATIVGARIVIPRDLDTLRQVRRCIAHMGEFRRDRKYEDELGSVRLKYARSAWGYPEIEVVMILDGSNCRRVKVGEETVVQELYQIVCDGG